MHLFRYALRNISRNIFLSLSSLMIIGLLVFFANILILVIFSTDRFIANITDRIAISINLHEGHDRTSERVQSFLSGMTTTFSGAQVDYISKEEALSLLAARNPDLVKLLEDDANPLSESIRISRIGNNLSLYDRLNQYISGYHDIFAYESNALGKMLLDYQSQYNRIASVIDVLRILQIGVAILLILFVLTVAIVVYMVIHNFVFFLQDEIRIIELVGGRPSFIYGPFVIQGILYTFFASGAALIGFYALIYFASTSSVLIDYRVLLQNFLVLFPALSLLVLSIFSCIGAFSAFLASWKYIHTTIGE